MPVKSVYGNLLDFARKNDDDDDGIAQRIHWTETELENSGEIFFSKFSYFYGTGKEKFLNKTWIYSISIYILLINFWQKKIVKKEAEGKINITFHIYLSYLTSSDYL